MMCTLRYVATRSMPRCCAIGWRCASSSGGRVCSACTSAPRRRAWSRCFAPAFPGEPFGWVTRILAMRAGWVGGELEGQRAEPVPGPLATAHAVVRAYLAHGTDAMPVAQALPALRALSGCQSAYRLLDQFLPRMPNLRSRDGA